MNNFPQQGPNGGFPMQMMHPGMNMPNEMMNMGGPMMGNPMGGPMQGDLAGGAPGQPGMGPGMGVPVQNDEGMQVMDGFGGGQGHFPNANMNGDFGNMPVRSAMLAVPRQLLRNIEHSSHRIQLCNNSTNHRTTTISAIVKPVDLSTTSVPVLVAILVSGTCWNTGGKW